jgi:uncharacterized protein involved in exopolysaccharide biosynthesis
MEDEIDLRDAFHFVGRILRNGLQVVWKNRILIISIFIIAVLVAGLISFTITPLYRASCIIAVGNYGDPIYTNATMAKEFMLSDECVLQVIDTLNLDVPPEKLRGFKENIKITKNITTDVWELSIETQDQQNATKVVTEIALNIINRSEYNYIKYNKFISEKIELTQKNIEAIDKDISLTREVLRNIDQLPGITQEQLELSHSRTLESLQNAESKRAALFDQYMELKRQLDFMEKTRILMISEEPTQPVWPRKAMIVGYAGFLGLIIGIIAAFLRRPVE